MHSSNSGAGAAERNEPSRESIIESLPGILQAYLDLVLPDQQPPMPRIAAALGDAPEIEAQNKFLCRNILAINVLANSRYQQFRIEIVGTDQPLAPFESPFRHHLDHRPKRLSGFRQRIDMAPALFLRIGMNDAGDCQLFQALRQHRSGDKRNGREEITKGPGTIIKLADDQRRPSIAEYLGGLCDGAKLTVSDHDLDDISDGPQAIGLFSVTKTKTRLSMWTRNLALSSGRRTFQSICGGPSRSQVRNTNLISLPLRLFLIVDRAALAWRDERIIINGKHRSGSRRLAWRLVLPSHGGCAAQDGAGGLHPDPYRHRRTRSPRE